jgi:mRNA interferase RelE/StbE
LDCKLQFDKKAIKDLQTLGKDVAKRILSKIEFELVNKPGADKRLKGDKSEFYSYRIGSYRVIYEFSDNVIVVYKISHRKNAYD